MTQPQLLSTGEVRDILGITTRQAARMINSGQLPSVEIKRGDRRVPLQHLLDWIAVRVHDPDDTLIPIRDAASILDVNDGILRRMVEAGLLPHVVCDPSGLDDIKVRRSVIVRLARELSAEAAGK
jgi:predicted site-specific integrase-resolvase